MRVTITVMVSERREVKFSDYDLDEENYTEEDLIEAVEEDINTNIEEFVASNSTGCTVEKTEE